MTVLSTPTKANRGSPTKARSPTSGLKRKHSAIRSSATPFSSEKRRRPAEVTQSLQRPTKPAGKPWPVNDLRVFDAPTERELEVNHGPILETILKQRGWKYSVNPCHGEIDREDNVSTFYIKEFEASVRGKTPEELFGKSGCLEKLPKPQKGNYRLKALPLPKHALWMMGRMPYQLPGSDIVRERDDFCKIIVKHGKNLTGEAGNYRIAKFPGTEKLLWKTNLTEAFNHKSWYPTTYILPRDKTSFLREIQSRGNSKHNMWIGKPRNDYGGSGITVWKGTDPDLIKTAKTSDGAPPSLVQSYLADPLLVGGYKFHCRIHLVITNMNPLEAYVQENGQCLFATKPYTVANNNIGTSFDPPVHVTNMCLNAKPKNKENYFKKKPLVGAGQQIRMKQLMSYLSENYPGFDKLHKQRLWQEICAICADTASYIAQGVQKHHKIAQDRHFEIFGMDLMLDKDLKVWMCEVNTDPGLGYPDKLVLGSPNPDYDKEQKACEETWHDLFTLLGLDAGRPQSHGSLKHWFKLDFPEPAPQA